MNADDPAPQGDPYRCPGQQHSISRAVHLGRLAAFYPACRQCPCRDETGTISPRRVAQLAETSCRGRPHSLFHDEGAGGVYLNDLTPAAAKNIAAAFGVVLREAGREERGEGRGADTQKGTGTSAPSEVGSVENSNPQSLIPNPAVLLAGDGRPLSAELVAAAAEGLRSTGCDVVDLGPSTSPCLAFAMRHLEAVGGVLVGNPGEDSHTVGMKFWTAGPRPLSAGGSLEPITERYKAGDCPDFRLSENGTVPFVATRHYGQLHRFRADGPYLAQMATHYHALRPLRVVVDSASRPTIDFLRRLAAAVACEVIASRSVRNELPQQIRDDAAHFAVCIDGDGETCHALDEQGCPIPPERLLLLLAVVGGDTSRRLPAAPSQSATGVASYKTKLTGTIVLENDTAQAVADRLKQLGMQVITRSPRRADMAAVMQEYGAILGGGPSGRFWHAELGLPLCDALMTVTRLLQTLSRSDDPLSQVLDREALLE